MLNDEFKRLVDLFNMPKFIYQDEYDQEQVLYYKDGVSLKYKNNKIYVTLLNKAIDYSRESIGNLRRSYIRSDSKEYEFYKNNMLSSFFVPYCFYVDGNSKTIKQDIDTVIKLIMNGFLNLSRYYDMEEPIQLINNNMIDSYHDVYGDIFDYQEEYKERIMQDKNHKIASDLRISINDFSSIAKNDMYKDKNNILYGCSRRLNEEDNKRLVHIYEDDKAKWLYELDKENYLLTERVSKGFGTQLEINNYLVNHSFINGEEIILVYVKPIDRLVEYNLTNNTKTEDYQTRNLTLGDLKTLTKTIKSAYSLGKEIYDETIVIKNR